MTIAYEPGLYQVRHVSQRLGKSRNKGTPQITLTFRPYAILNPQTGEYESMLGPYDRTAYLYMTDKTSIGTLDKIESIGIVGLHEWRQVDENEPDCIRANQTYVVECRREEYEGRIQDKWEIPGSGIEVIPMDETEKKNLERKFGKLLKDRGSYTPIDPPVVRPAVRSERFEEQTMNPIIDPNLPDDLPF